MACINKGKPFSPRIKIRALQKLREQESATDQAYLVTENDGISVYLSYELNKSLEQVFHKYSISGYMGVTEFRKMCVDYNILPQNTDKDLICYIFTQRSSQTDGYVDFKGFFQILHRLSCYAFRKLIMTEQEKFNVLIKHLNVIKDEPTGPGVHRLFNVGIQVFPQQNTIGVNASVNKKDVSCGTSIKQSDKECMTDPVQFQKEDTTEVDSQNKNYSLTTSKVVSTSIEEEEIKKKLEDIEKDNDTEQLNKLKVEIENALNIIQNKNTEIKNLQDENLQMLNAKDEQLEQMKSQIQILEQAKNELEEKKNELQHGVEEQKKENEEKEKYLQAIQTEFVNLKKTIILYGEEEGELFKIFFKYSTYDPEFVEYTMDTKGCASFLATHYLLRKKTKQKQPINLTAEEAARLFKETVCDMNKIENKNPERSKLNYFYFKALLKKIGNYLYPDLTEREAFLEIVMKHIFVVHANEKTLNKRQHNKINTMSTSDKRMSTPMSTKNTVSQDFDFLKKEIQGGYASSTQEDDSLKINVKKKKKGSGKLIIPNEKRDTKIVKRENSFEYIESDEVNKIKNVQHKEKMTKKKLQFLERNSSIALNNKKKVLLNNFINKDIKYNQKYGYDTSADDSSSITSLSSGYVPVVFPKKDHMKKNKTNIVKKKNDFSATPNYMLHKSKLIDLKREASYPNDFQKRNASQKDVQNVFFQNDDALCDIEGTIWPLASGKKEYFLAKFGA